VQGQPNYACFPPFVSDGSLTANAAEKLKAAIGYYMSNKQCEWRLYRQSEIWKMLKRAQSSSSLRLNKVNGSFFLYSPEVSYGEFRVFDSPILFLARYRTLEVLGIYWVELI